MTNPTPSPAVPKTRLPSVIYVVAAGTFLMGTTEFVVAGLLPEMAADFDTTVALAGIFITIFAIGMIFGAPLMALLTLRLPRRTTLTLALVLFAIGHMTGALSSSFGVLLAARLLTALATGAFWAVGSVVAAKAAGPSASSRALGLVLGGGMLANVLGVPLGSFSGQLFGWRGTFWALAVLALLVAVVVARFIPADAPERIIPSVRTELRALRSGRLWLTLATCATVNAGVLSVYSFIAPLIIDRSGLSAAVIPFALMAFGTGALVGNVIGGRLGDNRPYGTSFVTASMTLLTIAGIGLFSAQPALLLILFTVLGVFGLSANPILVSLAVRFGADSPTLAAAMPTSIFNLGTAVGTGITSILLETSLGPVAPAIVGTIFAAFTFVPLTALAVTDRRVKTAHGCVQQIEPCP